MRGTRPERIVEVDMLDDRMIDAHFDGLQPPDEEESTVECALCGDEVDEETTMYGICEKCWSAHHNFDNALAYGATAQESVKINGLFAKALTPDQINEALKSVVMGMKKEYPDFTERMVREFLSDDDGDYAEWLVNQKNK